MDNQICIPHSDEPTLDDLLDRRDMIKQVARAVAFCQPPQVYGVHGDWGSGKTSFLYQLHEHLIGERPQQAKLDPELDDEKAGGDAPKGFSHVTVIWFEAWRYQFEQAPVVALLQEIRAQLPWYRRLQGAASKTLEVTIRGALLSLEDITKRIGIQASKIQEAGEKWEQENLASRLPSHSIRDHLEDILDKLLGKGDDEKADRKRLVVLVDDLDRCESEPAYKLLEGIKIYLNLPNCVFVLGMNQRIIEAAVAKHLGRGPEDDEQETALNAREYVEKLCQNIWHLPLVADPGTALAKWLPDVPDRAGITGLLRNHRCLPANPRKIKAFCNVFGRLAANFSPEAHAAPPAGPGAHPMLLLVIAYIYQFHPEMYRILETRPDFYDKILNWSKDEV